MVLRRKEIKFLGESHPQIIIRIKNFYSLKIQQKMTSKNIQLKKYFIFNREDRKPLSLFKPHNVRENKDVLI